MADEAINAVAAVYDKIYRSAKGSVKFANALARFAPLPDVVFSNVSPVNAIYACSLNPLAIFIRNSSG